MKLCILILSFMNTIIRAFGCLGVKNSVAGVVSNLVVALGLIVFSDVVHAQLQPPQNISATNNQVEQVTVTWSHPAAGAPHSYHVFRSATNEGCVGASLQTIPGVSTSFVDTTLPNTNLHYYSLRSVAPSGETSECSNTAQGNIIRIPPPDTAQNVRATTDNYDLVRVTWDLPTNSPQPVTGWKLYRTTNPTLQACHTEPYRNLAAGATSYDDTEAVVNEWYYYALKSVGAGGDGNCSNWWAGVRPQPPRPNPPSMVSASDGTFADKVRVDWTPPSTGGLVTEFRIFRSTTDTVQCTNTGSGDYLGTVASGVQTYDDTSATPGVRYYYQIQSFGPYGSACGPVDPGFRRLSPPASISATDGDFPDRVNITWPLAPGANIAGYRIYNNPTCSGTPVVTAGSGETLKSDTSAIPGVIYNYSIQTVATASIGSAADSECGPVDPGHAHLSPPRNVNATDGTYPNKVDVTWIPPATGSNFGPYQVFRNGTCSGTPIGSTTGNLYEDFGVTPGVIYDYSVRLTSSVAGVSPSPCSPLDPGHAALGAPQNVQATDGTYPDKVRVTWNPVPSATMYKVYRGPNCSSMIGESNSTTFDDTGAIPGRQYVYSVRPVSSGGLEGACSSNDPGHASILPPPLRVTTSSTPEALVPGWTKPLGDITGYELYRSENPGDRCVGTPIARPSSSAVSYTDEDVEKGQVYYYSILATSAVGNSACSSAESALLEGEALRSPAFVKFNTYLGQWNFAELTNQGSKKKDVTVTVFNLRGEEMAQTTITLDPNSQFDVNIHGMIETVCKLGHPSCAGFEDRSATVGAPNGASGPDGIVDTYGLVRFEFDDSNPAEKLLGRMSFYRPNVDKSFSFAFAREFRNPLKGASYAVSNTFDQSGNGYLVPNWVEVINFGTRDGSGNLHLSAQSYTVKLYDQAGKLKSNRRVTLQPLGEFDVHGGHEFVDGNGKVIEGVYLVEVIPDNPNAEYFLSVPRYSSSDPAVEAVAYNYAFDIYGQNGTDETIYAPVGNFLEGVFGVSDKVYADNWVEVACVSNTSCDVLIRYVQSDGVQAIQEVLTLAPKSQLHRNASAILKVRSIGSVHVVPLKGKVIAQSLSYVNGSQNNLQTAFVSPARAPGGQVQSGSINTYLGIQNVLNTFSTSSTTTSANYLLTPFGSGAPVSGSMVIGGESVNSMSINENSALNIGYDIYGALRLSTANPGSVSSEVRRVRILPNGNVDFVMPTLVK